MRSLLTLVLTVLITSGLQADISLPKKDNFYDKLGRGFANVIMGPLNIADSFYTTLETDGPTVAISKGMVQGVGRSVSDIGLGVSDILTSPFPTGPDSSYRSWKQKPYNSMVVNEYPPADLLNNWY